MKLCCRHGFWNEWGFRSQFWGRQSPYHSVMAIQIFTGSLCQKQRTLLFTLCGWYEDYSSNKLYDNAVAYIAADFWQTSAANETNTKSALSLTVSAEGIDQLCAGLEPLNALQEVTDLSKVGSSKHSAGYPIAAAIGMIVTIMVCGSLLIYNVFLYFGDKGYSDVWAAQNTGNDQTADAEND